MATERSTLEILLRSRKTGTGTRDTQAELGNLKKASGEAGAAAERLNLGLLAAQGAAIGAGLAFLRAVPGLIDLGVRAERADTALAAMAGGAEEGAAALEAVQRAAGGAINRLDAAQNATRLFSMGLASNAEEAERLTRIAITLGATMGVGPQEAFENFTLLLANQSILRLDTFGISGAVVRERMEEMAEEGIAPADRQLRFLNATMEEAELKMLALDEAGFSATTSIDRFGAKVEDAKISFGTWLADGLLPVLDVIEAMPDALDAADRFLVSWLNSTASGTDLWTEYEILVKRAETATRDYSKAAAEADASTDAVAESVATLTANVVGLSAAQIGAEAMRAINKAAEEGRISQEEYDQAFREVGSTLLGLPKAQLDLSLAVRDSVQAFEEGAVGLEPFITGMQVLNEELSRGDRDVTATYEIEFGPNAQRIIETGGGTFGFQSGGSFVVGGPPGPDRTPVFFMASRGERVTIDQSAGGVPPESAPSGGGGRNAPLIGTFVSSGAMDDQIFLEKFRRIARRS